MEFKIERLAIKDIQEAIDYYNSKQKNLGKKFHTEVKKYFTAIQKNPRYQIRYENVRCLPLKKFPAMIHFTFDEKTNLVIIRAVLNTHLDPEKNWKIRTD